MNIAVIGLSHKTAPVHVREKLSIPFGSDSGRDCPSHQLPSPGRSFHSQHL